MTKAQEFIARHNMDYRGIVLGEQVKPYLLEMERGLSTGEGSLLMVPSYVELKKDVRRNEAIICIDAGGTNFRIGVARFDEDGRFVMDEVERFLMPGVEYPLEANEFFRLLAEIIEPYLTYSRQIVMSFAYRARSTENIDMEIEEMTKEVSVIGAKGALIGYEIKKELVGMGYQDVKIAIINDTVASALSGKAVFFNKGYDAFTGTILGTGSNSCYIEKNANIRRICRQDGNMAVNLEAGNYACFPRSDIDQEFDRSTMYPGIGLAEKMSSGGYLGSLCEFALRKAEEEQVLCASRFNGIKKLRSEHVSEYLENGGGIIGTWFESGEDKANARQILENIVLRAARVVAVQMAAIAIKSSCGGEKILMTIEGSTYEKMHGLKQELHNELTQFLKEKSINAHIKTVDHAVLKGCAIAGLGK